MRFPKGPKRMGRGLFPWDALTTSKLSGTRGDYECNRDFSPIMLFRVSRNPGWYDSVSTRRRGDRGPDSGELMKLRPFVSLAVALFAFLMPRILFGYSGIAMWISFTLAGCWTVILIGGLYKFKKRGLWLLTAHRLHFFGRSLCYWSFKRAPTTLKPVPRGSECNGDVSPTSAMLDTACHPCQYRPLGVPPMPLFMRITVLLGLSIALYGQTGASVPSSNVVSVVDAKCSSGFSSLQLDRAGNPVIGYSAYCQNSSNQALKVAHCGNHTCSAGNSIYVLDSGSSHGNFPTDAALLVGANGNPVVSYFYGNLESPSGDLRVAFCGTSTCSSGNSIITADANGTTGIGSSLVLDGSGNPVVSYVSLTSGLRLLHCSDATCASNTSTTVDSGSILGVTTSLALDSSGNPVIAYEATANSQQVVSIAHCSNTDCSGTITFVTLDTLGGLGWYTGPSLRLDSTGNPVVSYFTQGFSEQYAHLKVAHCEKADCSANNSIIAIDDDTSAPYGHSLVLDRSGDPVLSYSSGSTRLLTIAHCGDANCASGNTFAHGDPNPTGPSAALDSQNRPVISYAASKSASSAAQLRVLHCATITCQ